MNSIVSTRHREIKHAHVATADSTTFRIYREDLNLFDASDHLLRIINDRINHHMVECLTSLEQSGRANANSERLLLQLKRFRHEAKTYLSLYEPSIDKFELELEVKLRKI